MFRAPGLVLFTLVGLQTWTEHGFVLKYFTHSRDFRERATYETRVLGALDEAHDFAQRLLGCARVAPLDVVLYTAGEFRLHFGPSAARAIAGLYSEDAMRINDAA